jgi:hypothetical protein
VDTADGFSASGHPSCPDQAAQALECLRNRVNSIAAPQGAWRSGRVGDYASAVASAGAQTGSARRPGLRRLGRAQQAELERQLGLSRSAPTLRSAPARGWPARRQSSAARSSGRPCCRRLAPGAAWRSRHGDRESEHAVLAVGLHVLGVECVAEEVLARVGAVRTLGHNHLVGLSRLKAPLGATDPMPEIEAEIAFWALDFQRSSNPGARPRLRRTPPFTRWQQQGHAVRSPNKCRTSAMSYSATDAESIAAACLLRGRFCGRFRRRLATPSARGC